MNKFLAVADSEPAVVPLVTSYFAKADEIPPDAVSILVKTVTTTTNTPAVRAEAMAALTRTADPANWDTIFRAVPAVRGVAGGPGGIVLSSLVGSPPLVIPNATPIQQMLASAIDGSPAGQARLQAVVDAQAVLFAGSLTTGVTPATLARQTDALAAAERALALARAEGLAAIQTSVARLTPAQVDAFAAQSLTALPTAVISARLQAMGIPASVLAQVNAGDGASPLEQVRQAVLGSPRLDEVHPRLIEEAAKLNGESSLLADAALLTLSARVLGASAPREAAARAIEAGWRDPRRRVQILLAAVIARDTSRAAPIVAATKDADAAVRRAAEHAVQQLAIDPVQLAAATTAPKIGTMPVAAVLDAVVPARGTVARGAQLVRELACTACHTVSASEAPKGPPLNMVSAILPRRALAEAILVPSHTIAQGFATTQIVRRSGATVTGFVVEEQPDTLTIRDVTSQVTRVPASDIASRTRLDLSMMPPGLANNLTIAEFASLLDYIESLGR